MVEHDLAKVGVAGSNPVSRSSKLLPLLRRAPRAAFHEVVLSGATPLRVDVGHMAIVTHRVKAMAALALLLAPASPAGAQSSYVLIATGTGAGFFGGAPESDSEARVLVHTYLGARSRSPQGAAAAAASLAAGAQVCENPLAYRERRRTQVVKGADCKSVMRRFESARRLHSSNASRCDRGRGEIGNRRGLKILCP